MIGASFDSTNLSQSLLTAADSLAVLQRPFRLRRIDATTARFCLTPVRDPKRNSKTYAPS